MSAATSYFVYSVRGLPAGIWGESYAVVTAFESSPNELTSEFFLLTKRPTEALHSGAVTVEVSPLPEELGKIDLEFTLQEGVRQVELSMADLLERRAVELSRPDLAYLQFELKPTSSGNLLGCWMRGQFNAQLKAMQAKTQCQPLKSYLGLFSQVGIITRS